MDISFVIIPNVQNVECHILQDKTRCIFCRRKDDFGHIMSGGDRRFYIDVLPGLSGGQRTRYPPAFFCVYLVYPINYCWVSAHGVAEGCLHNE
jgi:hypothetical protein